MTEAEVLTGGGIVLVAMTLIQISPIKLDPWSAIARAVGRAINKDVIDKLDGFLPCSFSSGLKR